nr:Retrovirus-related Pol polyprotein from transposon TNT 1-94 [Ipomoea batatas]
MNCEEFNFRTHEDVQTQADDNPVDNDNSMDNGIHSRSYNEKNNGISSHSSFMQVDSHTDEAIQTLDTDNSHINEPLENNVPSNDSSHINELLENSVPLTDSSSLPTDCPTDDRSLHSEPMQHNTSPLQPRRSGRQRHMPLRLQDFYCESVICGKSTPHTLSKVLSYDRLEPSHKVFSIAVTTVKVMKQTAIFNQSPSSFLLYLHFALPPEWPL